MNYGLRIKDAGGTVLLNTPDVVSRIRYSNVVNADSSNSTTLSDIAGKTVYAVSMPLEFNKIAHSVSISGTTFNWTAESNEFMNSADSLVFVIIMD